MKIAIVTHKVMPGDGQGRVNYEIAKAALEAGHRVTLVAAEISPQLFGYGKLDVVRVPTQHLPTFLLREQAFAVWSGDWLRRHRAQIDVLHVNGFVTWASGEINTAHFVHTGWLRSGHYAFHPGRGIYDAYQTLYSRFNAILEKMAFRQSGVVVAVSGQIAQELKNAGVAQERIRVIHNGVDTSEFRPGTTSNRTRLGLPENVFLAFFAGDLRTPRKNLDTVLKAVARIPDMHLAVAGDTRDSPYPPLAEALGISGRVHFLGLRRDMPELMRAADLFVFPSRYEPMGLVVLEAMASGMPIVTACKTGGAEILTPECGIVTDDPEDDETLARIVSDLRKKPEAVVRMGRAARRLAEQYTWRRMAERYLSLYEELAG